MKKLSNIIWGIVLVAVGVLLALKAFDIVDFNIFFRGWWTLFIIIPCFCALFSGKDITWNIAGIVLGVLLLLSSNGLFSFGIIWKLILPAIIVLVGVKMIFGNFFHAKMDKAAKRTLENGTKIPEYCATFSEQKLNFGAQPFDGADFTSVFGSIDCDLRGASFSGDVVINATSVFGGIKLITPNDATVKVYSNSIFGSADNKKTIFPNEGGITIYVNATCIFGGVDII